LFSQGTVVEKMREFLQKQKMESPTFHLMHKIRGCGAKNDCFILIFCAMNISKQEVLTQPQRIELVINDTFYHAY